MATRGNFGSYLTTTTLYDASQLTSVDVTSPEFKQLLVRLYQNLSSMAHVINNKESSFYDNSLSDFVTANQWFPNPNLTSSSSTSPTFRVSQRAVINFQALPNNATKSVAHGITVTPALSWTRIEAIATNPTAPLGIPIPYASATAGNIIEINVDNTNVNITTNSDRTAFTICYVILEYLIS